MKNIKTCVLIIILLVMIVFIVFFSNSIEDKKTFVKPGFETSFINGSPEIDKFDEKIITISDGYRFYIEPVPSESKRRLNVNFTSLDDNNVWIKLRVLDSNNNIIGESGLLKEGTYLKNINLDKDISVNENITYVIMGYEIDSYLSAGTVTLQTKVGEYNG